MNRIVETPYVKLELLPNGILVATYKRRTIITLEMAKEIVSTRLAFTGTEPRPVLIYDEGVKVLDAETTKFIGSEEALIGIRCSAIIARKLTTHLIMVAVLAIKRRKDIPAKLYRREKPAMEWLETFL